MATKPRNNRVRSLGNKSLSESLLPLLSSAVSYNQGDMIAMGSGVVKAVTATGDSAAFLGIARQTVVNGVVQSPYQGTSVDGSQAIEDMGGPVYGDVCSMILKTGDAFPVMCPVFISAVDAQTVTSVDPGSADAIGIFQGKAVASAAAGQLGDCLIGARIYGSTLLF